MRLQLWDTAGQERFRSLIPSRSEQVRGLRSPTILGLRRHFFVGLRRMFKAFHAFDASISGLRKGFLLRNAP